MILHGELIEPQRRLRHDLIDFEVEISHCFKDVVNLLLGDPAPAMGDKQNVSDLIDPQRWNQNLPLSQSVEYVYAVLAIQFVSQNTSSLPKKRR